MRQDLSCGEAAVGEQLSHSLGGGIGLAQSHIVISETSEVADVLRLGRGHTSFLLLGGFLFLFLLLAALGSHATVHAIVLSILVITLVVLLINDLRRGLRFTIDVKLVSEFLFN